MAFPPQTIRNSFGEYLAHLGLAQLRIAETEKYAHVTYFFNGGVEAAYPGEDRVLVPSPRVATYDLQPEMSAPEVTDRLVAAIASRKYDAIVCNYANGDMVGHTGNYDAAVKAVETLDICIGRVVAAARDVGGEVLITADHGNAETMFDPATGQPHTAHTLNRVPFVYVGRAATMAPDGALAGHRADDAGADGPGAASGNDRKIAGAARAALTRTRKGTCGPFGGPSDSSGVSGLASRTGRGRRRHRRSDGQRRLAVTIRAARTQWRRAYTFYLRKQAKP